MFRCSKVKQVLPRDTHCFALADGDDPEGVDHAGDLRCLQNLPSFGRHRSRVLQVLAFPGVIKLGKLRSWAVCSRHAFRDARLARSLFSAVAGHMLQVIEQFQRGTNLHC